MTTPDITWTNQGKFNKLEFHLKASLDDTYVFSRNPSLPSYIITVKFGIVSATATVIHTKLRNGGHYEAKRSILECPNLSSTTPKTDLSCDLKNQYKIHFSVSTGGYRQLKNDWSFYDQNNYNAIKTENSMELHFDYDDPFHCTEDYSCTSREVPFILRHDVTKGALNPQWSGWKDKLSGILRYVFEVWKMEYSYDHKGLREPLINRTFNPVPLFIQEVNASDSISFPTYEPNEPGVYSAILEVNDKANNSKYARQVAIYDRTSNISTSSDRLIIVTTASELSNFTWQTSHLSKIDVIWSGHFVNEVHEKGYFLEKILDYVPRLDDGSEGRRHDYKKILPGFDDNKGERNKAAIPNIKSIIRFETVGIPGIPMSVAPKTGWEDVTPLNDNKSFPLTDIRDGDSYQLWIRAHDIMGNSKVDSTAVHFDRSKPTVHSVKIKYNIDDGEYPFSSRVRVSARDDHSGVRKVSFRFVVNGTLNEKAKKDFLIETKSKEICDRIPSDCYCVKMGECFLIKTVLDINNCWLKVPIHQVANFVLLLEVTVYNSAMLSSKSYVTIGTVKHLQGIQQYYSPSNITVVSRTSSSVSIKWIQAKTCYERAGIVIILYTPDNKTKEFPVDKDATTFDLSGLSSLTSYRFLMYTKYGNDTIVVTSASPAKFSFVTRKKETGFPTSGIAGIAGGFTVLLIFVIIVLVFLGRTGRLQPAKQRVTAGIRTVRNTIRVRPTTNSFNNRAIVSKEDDDIYFYGGMEIKENNMKISRKDISLESELARGRFAVIFLAKYYNKSECHEVVAKTLKDDQNAKAIMKMKAKINFYTKKVGRQKNVLEFIGSVEDEVRGPMMILEYCSKGVLKQFLEAIKSNMSIDIEEKLFRMVFGICQGMDFLASKQVVHRRLAARNILLNSILEPKITGFGPDPSYDEGEDNPGNERIPIKWVAPECMKSTQYANELSDVWSFGIVMWEIFSLGETPYPGLQSREVPGKLKKGYKMTKPELCDDAFYAVMLKCWHYDPKKRSGFEQLKEQMNNMFTEAPGDDYYYRTNDL
ncbi:Tyrosine-protein kinase receptor Tie-1,Mast/stem cell growth factor receptor-related protein Kit,Platelet-derived growth factor receptor alpha,Vascular endothelial growth factor receptor 2,Mast/stem cell growth factor receptor kita,Vascular endothelial growth factor receptor 1,Vascular endothelial growth factor receptor 3 [Mytilus coruscus]|uniref:Receptor protein-tyrosine kinase n=1 Tax=Mytilus coruscus TaxID=42192 RepID=A0A6J8APV7_MYTCO|nr:Tyrosine-protein kinase receptor Tie-1,Mast/stem cell growth factor receptor-related protein Kit,Platelet-derived growth factor receptor alpha,Vascular endothelial growth factor receptor 2,Mast/stem cell growth factor receptor kita,Vascular endothelial growth factor receptor 1,Vascular endothelial growth factor receptor 3 [Mytilus coruscus]